MKRRQSILNVSFHVGHLQPATSKSCLYFCCKGVNTKFNARNCKKGHVMRSIFCLQSLGSPRLVPNRFTRYVKLNRDFHSIRIELEL